MTLGVVVPVFKKEPLKRIRNRNKNPNNITGIFKNNITDKFKNQSTESTDGNGSFIIRNKISSNII